MRGEEEWVGRWLLYIPARMEGKELPEPRRCWRLPKPRPRRQTRPHGEARIRLDNGANPEGPLWQWRIWPQNPSGWMDPRAEESTIEDGIRAMIRGLEDGTLHWLLRD